MGKKYGVGRIKAPCTTGVAAMYRHWITGNRLAGRFARRAGQERTKKRVDRVLAWLEQQGILHSEMEVLDIGAGTGVFTVPLARRAARVTALEPAPEMLAALQKRVEAEGLANVYFLDREWEKVDPAAEGLAGRFDLVFASLTPGVRDIDTLMKMTACSRGWCFLCDFGLSGKSGLPRLPHIQPAKF